MNRAERRRREKKYIQKPVYYQYTLEQIEEIKRSAILAKKEEIKASIAKEMEDRIQREWVEREPALNWETDEECMLKVLALLMAVPAKVLCEKFHWKPIGDENSKKSRLMQFCNEVVREVNRICEDESIDIRAVVEEVYKKYGVKYEVK